jgi:DNA polymerase (family 10)
MDALRVARILDEMGTLLELRGENPFRCRAYRNAAQALKALPGDLAEMIAADELIKVPGIGATMLGKIARLSMTGGLPEYDDLRRETPPGLIALLRVPGLGPSKIQALRDTLSIASLDDLKAAALAGRLAAVKGFGARTQAKILEGIAFLEEAGDRMLQHRARQRADAWRLWLQQQPGVQHAEIAGELRRRCETIDDLAFAFAAGDPVATLDRIAARPDVGEVLSRFATSLAVRLSDGLCGRFRASTPDRYGLALWEATGSDAHLAAVRRHAEGRGFSPGDWEWLDPDQRPVPARAEADFYQALGLSPIPPELREGRGEVDAAKAGTLPRLVQRDDLLGTFHCHTDWSDGGATLEEMAEAARAAGLGYLGIADHSRSAAYAGGLSIERVRRQWQAIDALNARYNGAFRLFKGIECDILADGSLDYPDDVLAGFDYVVASVHSRFGLPREAMTERVVRAVSHPRVTILGHPTGRLLLAREGYSLDLHAVIEAVAARGTMIEINADPHRLDLDAEHARRARDRGVLIAINPDAHSTSGLENLDYGLGQARRAGLRPEDVVNTRPAAEVVRLFDQARSR